MFSVNTDALRHLLEGLSSGFRPTLRDLLIFAAVLIGFVGLLLAVYLIQRRWLARARTRRSRQTFTAVVGRRGLTAGEAEMLQDMAGGAGYGPQELHRVVSEPWAFNRASRRYLAQKPGADADVAALRFKLDFGRFDGSGPLHSTAEIQEPGLPVYLRQGNRTSGRARLAAAGPRALVLRMEGSEQAPLPGEEAQMFFTRADGVYGFLSLVRAVRGALVRLDHSERVARLQRRRYARCRASFPVRIRPLGRTGPTDRSYLVELGGGGATLFDSRGGLRERERLELELPLGEHRPLRVEARVVRAGQQGGRIHVEFSGLSDAQRDRVLGYVLSHQAAG